MKNLKVISISAIIVIILIILFISFFKKKPSYVFKTNTVAASELYSQADNLLKEGRLLEARDACKKILTDFPSFKEISQVEAKLQDLNMKIVFSSLATPKTTIYEVKSGDSLEKVAKKLNTTVELVKRSNNISSDVIRPKQPLRIWTGRFSCIVDKSQNTLTLKSDDDEVIKVYSVATGANNHTPVGTYKIKNKLINPVWYKDGKAFPPESPKNILGTRWMGFNLEEYGIHGTTQPETIGKQVTQGCVRMLNKDVEELYSILPVGTEVTIID